MPEKNDDRIPFSNDIDKDTQDSILYLNQKLTNLLVEINSKLSSPDLAVHHEGSEKHKDHFIALREEVKKALAGIEPLVHLFTGGVPVSTEALTCYREELNAMQAMVKDKANNG